MARTKEPDIADKELDAAPNNEAEVEEPSADGDWDEALEDESPEVEVASSEVDDDDEDDKAESGDEALDELEAEELEMLTDDEASETLPVDEAEELRALRRAALSLDEDGSGEREDDEFQCQNCFLVLKSSQLADKRRKLCRDCAG